MRFFRRRRVREAAALIEEQQAVIVDLTVLLARCSDPDWQERTQARCVDAVQVRGVTDPMEIRMICQVVVASELELLLYETGDG